MSYIIRLLILSVLVFSHILIPDNLLPSRVEKITAENVTKLAQQTTFIVEGGLLDLRFRKNDRVLTIDRSGDVLDWNLESGQSRVILNLNHPTQGALSPMLTDVVCACGDQSPVVDVERYDLNGSFYQKLILHFGPVFDLAWSADEKKVAISGGWSRDESRFEVWDVVQDQKLISLSDGHWVSHMSFDPTHANLIAVGYSNSIELWDYETHSKLFSFEQEYPISQFGSLSLAIGYLTFNNDGSILASMSPEGYIWLWDIKSGEIRGKFSDLSVIYDVTGTIYLPANCELRFDSDNRLLFAANGSTLRIWDVSSGQLLRTIEHSINHFTLNDQGSLLATADTSGTVTVWSIK